MAALGTAVLDLLRQAVARAADRSTILLNLSQRDAHALLSIADARLDAAALQWPPSAWRRLAGTAC